MNILEIKSNNSSILLCVKVNFSFFKLLVYHKMTDPHKNSICALINSILPSFIYLTFMFISFIFNRDQK